MKNIYVLLTRPCSFISRVIGHITGDKFTHVSIAYDSRLEYLCSFAPKKKFFPLPAGLVHESLYDGYVGSDSRIPCSLLKLPVSNDEYDKVCNEIESMMANSQSFSYSVWGLITCLFGKINKRSGEFFCSWFVAAILKEAHVLALPKDPSLIKPQDFAGLLGNHCIYNGSLAGLRDFLTAG